MPHSIARVLWMIVISAVGARVSAQSVGLTVLDRERGVLQHGTSVFILNLSTGTTISIGIGDHCAVDATSQQVMTARNSKDGQQCDLTLLDVRTNVPTTLAKSSIAGRARRVVRTNFLSYPFCIELSHAGSINSQFLLFRVSVSEKDDVETRSFDADPLPGIAGVGSMALYLCFAEGDQDRYAAVIGVSPTAQRLFPELAPKDPRTAAMSPAAFVVVDRGKITHGWPSVMRSMAIGNEWRYFGRIVAFRNDHILVASASSDDDIAFWTVDARSGKMAPLAWTRGVRGGILAINDSWKTAVFYGTEVRRPGRETGVVRIVTADGGNRVVGEFDDDVSLSAVFLGDEAIWTDGQHVWTWKQPGVVKTTDIHLGR